MADIDFDNAERLRRIIQDEIAEINTAIPAIIVSYEDGLAKVQPIGSRVAPEGERIEYPVISSVPVIWPRFAGDTAGVKGPVRPGDKCMLQFSQRNLDAFLESGEDDTRMHDLSDAVAIMGVYKDVSGNAANNADMIMYFGDAYIKLTPAGKLEIYAPGGTFIDTPEAENTGKLLNRQEITGQKGLDVTGIHGASGVSSRVTGNFMVRNGDMSAGGISFGSHVHGGVIRGTDDTDGPR